MTFSRLQILTVADINASCHQEGSCYTVSHFDPNKSLPQEMCMLILKFVMFKVKCDMHQLSSKKIQQCGNQQRLFAQHFSNGNFVNCLGSCCRDENVFDPDQIQLTLVMIHALSLLSVFASLNNFKQTSCKEFQLGLQALKTRASLFRNNLLVLVTG